MNQTTTAPTVRVRVLHARTQKNGWACTETTVELTGPVGTADDFTRDLADLMRWAHQDGLDESERRNQVEGLP